MLVIQRNVGERVWIGKDTCVEVVAIRGYRVRLGIHAPDYVQVLREELCESVWGSIPVGRSKSDVERNDADR